MTAEVFRVGERLRLDGRATLAGAASIGIVAVGVGIATRLGLLPQAAGLAIALLGLLVSLRWPLVPLFLLVAAIPIEEVLVLGELGTLSRVSAVLFIATYAIPRLGLLNWRVMPASGFAYFAWAIISVGWALEPSITLAAVPVLTLLFATATLVAIAVVDRPGIVRPLLWAYSVSAAVTAAIGISGYLGGTVAAGTRVAALHEDPAHFAAILLPAFVFGLYELLRGRLVPLSAAVTFACGAGLLISGTRGAWVGTAVAVGVFLLPRLKPRQVVAGVGLLLAVIVISLQVPGLATLVTERTQTAISSGGAGRTDIWSVGLTIYSEAPVTGVGLANFPVAYTPEVVRETNVGEYAATRPPNSASHSIIIGTLGELGPIGLLLLAWLVVPLVLRRGWGPEGAVVQAALAGLLVDALFLDLLNRKQVWLLIGLACGLTYLAVARTVRHAKASEHSAASPPAVTSG